MFLVKTVAPVDRTGRRSRVFIVSATSKRRARRKVERFERRAGREPLPVETILPTSDVTLVFTNVQNGGG
jgi:hypothetical protein